MKLSVFICFAVLFLCYSSCRAETVKMPAEQWKEFKLKHNRNYSPEEDATRFEIFKENLIKIEEHNAKHAKGEVSYTMGINQFADQTPAERSGMMGVLRPPPEGH